MQQHRPKHMENGRLHWSRTVAFFHLNIHDQKTQINCLLFLQNKKFQLVKTQQAIHLGQLTVNIKMKKSHCPDPIKGLPAAH